MPKPAPLNHLLQTAADRLDVWPAAWAGGAGAAVGLAAGAGLLWTGDWPGFLGFGLVLLGAAGLAWSGVPLAIESPAPPPTKQVDSPPPEPEPPDPLWADIPAGTFMMGGDGYPQRKVRVSAFRCQRVPVTRRLYREITGTDPGSPDGDADERPVNKVSWFDAVNFCNRWSERDGLSPCYRIDGKAVTLDPSADGYRLLTDAEWEYACRAGTTTRWSFGDDESAIGEYAPGSAETRMVSSIRSGN